MAIHFACYKCQAKLHAIDGMEGRRVNCRNCRAALVIPGGPPTANAPYGQPGASLFLKIVFGIVVFVFFFLLTGLFR